MTAGPPNLRKFKKPASATLVSRRWTQFRKVSWPVTALEETGLAEALLPGIQGRKWIRGRQLPAEGSVAVLRAGAGGIKCSEWRRPMLHCSWDKGYKPAKEGGGWVPIRWTPTP